MKAIVITQPGGPEVLQVQERDVPSITANEVLIKVHYAGINRPDVLQRKGKYNPPLGIVADVPGLEVAGIVAQVGASVKNISVGDEVMALLAGGGYSEYVAVHAAMCIVKPTNISLAEASILPETLYTVWHNLFERGKLSKGDRVLIHGGAGGIGSTAIQLAKSFGAIVYTTVSSNEKEKYCRSIGADITINYKELNFEEVIGEAVIDVILDSIGGSYFQKNLHVLAEEGRLVYINAMKGAKVELNLLKLMQKRILLTGSTLRARDLEFKLNLTKRIRENIIPLIESGLFKPQLHEIFLSENIAEAHQMMEDGAIFGKISVIM